MWTVKWRFGSRWGNSPPDRAESPWWKVLPPRPVRTASRTPHRSASDRGLVYSPKLGKSAEANAEIPHFDKRVDPRTGDESSEFVGEREGLIEAAKGGSGAVPPQEKRGVCPAQPVTFRHPEEKFPTVSNRGRGQGVYVPKNMGAPVSDRRKPCR